MNMKWYKTEALKQEGVEEGLLYILNRLNAAGVKPETIKIVELGMDEDLSYLDIYYYHSEEVRT